MTTLAPAAQPVAFESPRRVDAEDLARADYYALLASLFYRPPDVRLLQAIVIAAPPQGDAGHELAAAWEGLAAASSVVTAEAVAEEYESLFGGTGRAAVMLFGSFYLAGFLNEKPLAALRSDLAEMGFSRNESAGETEDHIAALCDVMRVLILGDLSRTPADVATQKTFFKRHFEPWALRCCDATTEAEKANYYRKVAAFARAFLSIEIQAFEMA